MKPTLIRAIGFATLLPIIASAQTGPSQPPAPQAAASPATEGNAPAPTATPAVIAPTLQGVATPPVAVPTLEAKAESSAPAQAATPAVIPPILQGTATPPVAAPTLEATASTGAPSLVEASKPPASPDSSPTPALQATLIPSQDSILPKKGDILLNFQNASLADVLSYLSEAAGFVILQEQPVTGTVTIVSRQSVSPDEAVDLLNSVLVEKGYAAIRNGRILKIVSRGDAQKRDLPVMQGSDPTQIPRKDQVVTQILPLRYLDAPKLVENLRPLLSADATISANESSNSILLGDTQTNIHRIAEIIHALDTSISSISTIHVFQLQYADSKSLATVLTTLFATDTSARSGAGNNQPPGGGGFGGRRGGPFAALFGGGQQASQPSAAQQAAMRVLAVSDDQSNSVIVSAPEEVMTTITDIVTRIDTPTTAITEVRIFQLQFADCTELSNILNSLYSTTGQTTTAGNNGAPRFGPPQFQQQQNAQQQAGKSQRALQEAAVVTVPDPRTNSLIVNAAHETMEQIALSIGRLDATDTRKQHVYVYSLQNADPDNVATILRGMFSSQNSSSSTGAQPSSSMLNQRTQTGASSDVTNTINTSSGSTPNR